MSHWTVLATDRNSYTTGEYRAKTMLSSLWQAFRLLMDARTESVVILPPKGRE